MLVCNVSARPVRAAISADIAEVLEAADVMVAGSAVATLLDEPASGLEFIDAFFGDMIFEAASADDAVTAGSSYLVAIDEAATADAVVDISYDSIIDETVTATETLDATVTVAALTTWNPADKHATVTLSGGDLIAAGNTAFVAGGVRGTKSVGSGKAYFELTLTVTINIDNFMGVAPASKVIDQGTGNNCAVVNTFGGAIFVNSTTSAASIGDFANGDVLCVAIDLTNQRIWLRRNSGNWNNSGTANPATNTDGLDVSSIFTSAPAYPWALFTYPSKTNVINAGASAFAQTIPSGFVSWNSA